jgi:hypothetical protein
MTMSAEQCVFQGWSPPWAEEAAGSGGEAATIWVGLDPPDRSRGPTELVFDSGSEALAALRLFGAELVIVGTRIADMAASEFARQLRHRAPRQRWVLVAPNLEAAEEIAARSLGAIAVLDAPPTGQTEAGKLASAPPVHPSRLTSRAQACSPKAPRRRSMMKRALT